MESYNVNAVVGVQWGDEGKGRVVDYLASDAELVIRFQGGDNAGHTVINEYGKFGLHILPSGIFNPDTMNIVGAGTVVNFDRMHEELEDIRKTAGLEIDNVFIDERAHIIMPYHMALDGAEEGKRSEKEKIGTTKRGIGPCYSDKAARMGIRAADIMDEERLKERLALILPKKNRDLEYYGLETVTLEAMLEKRGNKEMLKILNDVANLANIYYIRQKVTRGLGDAVLRAKEFVGSEPFAVLYGDDVIIGEPPAIGELCEAYEKFGKSVVGIKEVSDEFIVKYSSLKVEKLDEKKYSVTDMIEKPALEEKFSNFSILGRCVLDNEIFDILEKTPLGVGGELQLTDAMRTLALKYGMIGVDFSGVRYDMGNKFGILKANIEVGLSHPEIKEQLKDYIKELAKTL